MTTVANVLFFALALSGLVGCAGSDSEESQSGPGTGGNTQLDASDDKGSTGCINSNSDKTLAVEIAKAGCGAYDQCCKKVSMNYDQASCEAALTPFIQELVDGAYCRGGSVYPSAIAECVAATQAYVGSCADSEERRDAWMTAFRKALHGTSKTGETCENSLDCASGSNEPVVCEFWSSTDASGKKTSGVLCQGTALQGEGQPCQISTHEPVHQICDDAAGLFCDWGENFAGTCKKKLAPGTMCRADKDCIQPAKCTGICTSVAPGASCQSIYQCDPASTCLSDTQACGKPKVLGEACTTPDDCESKNCDAGKCFPSSWLINIGTPQHDDCNY